jgi:cobalt-zinc-cadmium efflux system protein
VVNLAATWTLSKTNRQSMNVEGAHQHILTDLIAFIVTAISGAVIPHHWLSSRGRDRIPGRRCGDAPRRL